MPLLDTVKQMQSQGLADVEITQKLQEQGLDPREIDDALNQSKIKAAVSGGYEQEGQASVMQNATMQPSITDQQQEQAPQQSQQEYYPETYQQPAYQQEYYQPQSMGTETVTEIADQIVSEKISDIKKSLSLIADFKTTTDAKVSNIDTRLKKIEASIDKLQSGILGRVGEFGQAVQDIKQEMGMMQDSFSKVVSQAVSNTRRPQETPRQEPRTSQEQSEEESEASEQSEKMQPSITDKPVKQSRKKSRDGFENYLSR